MDLIGTAMAAVTIPMALLTLAGAIGAVGVLAGGDQGLVAASVVAFALGMGLAYAVDGLTIRIETRAYAVLRGGRTGSARWLGALSGALPVALLVAWHYLCLTRIAMPAPRLTTWLLAYLVATGPWTLVALLVGRERRTVCGIRAYAGHLGFWLGSVAALIAGAGPVAVILAMAPPTILPLIVGSLIATADRDALRNVRV